MVLPIILGMFIENNMAKNGLQSCFVEKGLRYLTVYNNFWYCYQNHHSTPFNQDNCNSTRASSFIYF